MWLVVAAVVLVALLPVSVLVGEVPITAQQAWDAYFHFDPLVTEHLLVRNVRVPRTIIAVIVGAALGASVIIQALTRNRGSSRACSASTPATSRSPAVSRSFSIRR